MYTIRFRIENNVHTEICHKNIINININKNINKELNLSPHIVGYFLLRKVLY